MFVHIEQTPNPSTLKFLPGCRVMTSGTIEFTDSAEASRASPLASRLFSVEGVTGVFLGSDFITVTKSSNKDWQLLKVDILDAIVEHFLSAAPILTSEAEKAIIPDTTDSSDDNQVVSQIKELLDTRIRPAVAMDGGDINFRHYEDGIVYLQLRGACSGCPSSTATLKAGIENMLRHYIPEVREVRASI